MKGSKAVIGALNDVLGGELIGINQYFLHAKMCKNWGFERLAENDYKESIDEMKHAEKIVERILFLDGVPNLQKLGKILRRRDGPRAAEERPHARDRGRQEAESGHRALRRRGRQHVPRAAGGESSRVKRIMSTGWRRSSG